MRGSEGAGGGLLTCCHLAEEELAGSPPMQRVTAGAGGVRGVSVKVVFRIRVMQMREGLGQFSETGHMICCLYGGRWEGARRSVLIS